MLFYFLAGISLGLSAGFSPGPLLAMVISHTLRYGVRTGIIVACAPLLTDVPIVIAITLLLSSLTANTPLLGGISVVGGLFVAYLAYENWQVSAPAASQEIAAPGNSLLKAAMVNALNPHPYLFWIAVGSPLIINASLQGIEHVAAFVIPFYSGLIGAKVILAVLVNRSREFLSGTVYHYTMKALSLLLILCAALLLREGVKLLTA